MAEIVRFDCKIVFFHALLLSLSELHHQFLLKTVPKMKLFFSQNSQKHEL